MFKATREPVSNFGKYCLKERVILQMPKIMRF
jgi:hypothetical protein